MTLINFLQKHRRILNIYRLEMHSRVKRNTIHHALSRENRTISVADADAIYKQIMDMYNDMVDLHTKHDVEMRSYSLSLNHGSNHTRHVRSKRKAQ